MKRDTVFLVLTSAVVLGGEIRRANSIIEVDDRQAADLLRRGRARVATEADNIPVQPEEAAAETAGFVLAAASEQAEVAEQAPKRRGRPRKNIEQQPEGNEE